MARRNWILRVSPFEKWYYRQWREGKFHGKGTKTNPDGTKYEGEWVKGKPQGKGIWYYEDGSKYEGSL